MSDENQIKRMMSATTADPFSIKPDWKSGQMLVIDELAAPQEQPDIVQQVRSLVNDKAVLESKLKDMESQRTRLQIAVEHATRNIKEEKDSSVSKSRLLAEAREDIDRLQGMLADANKKVHDATGQLIEANETIRTIEREYNEIHKDRETEKNRCASLINQIKAQEARVEHYEDKSRNLELEAQEHERVRTRHGWTLVFLWIALAASIAYAAWR